MTFPLPLETLVGKPLMYLIFALIGFAFGYVLEISGFGNSKKLAAQFYFKDLTVLKVMFTAIVVAMTLIFLMVGLGILDYNGIWVNPTYLGSGIVGGLIMGIGFIIGGFCPGTSVVSASTGKLDGIVFLLGGLFGAFLFGETEALFSNWWNYGGYYGRVTLMDVLHLPAGIVVLLIVLMALFMFWGGEQLERIIGGRDLNNEPKLRLVGAGALVVLAVSVILVGVPSLNEKYARVNITREFVQEAPANATPKEIETLEPVSLQMSADEALQSRQMQVSPAELFATQHNQKLKLVMLDVRPETQYNLFHIRGATNIQVDELSALATDLIAQYTPNRVIIVMSNDETFATQAWKTLAAESVSNVYILEGGLNNWIAFFGEDDPNIQMANANTGDEQFNYVFPAALGDRYESADPSPIEFEELEYEAKIQLQLKRDKSGGGCG